MQPEILYQYPPRQQNTFYLVEHRRNWTASMETYQNSAKREYELLMANPREANHEIVIGYLKEHFIKDLIKQFSLIKEHLTQSGIIAYQVAEITTNGFGKPVNRLHRHFLIDAIYGQHSRWFEITDDLYDGAGKFRIEIGGDDILEIKDITDGIPVFSRDTRFYILVNGERTEYQWVIVVPQDTKT